MKTFVLDLDDTMADLANPLSELLNEMTGKSLKFEDLHKFDWVDLYGVTDQEFFDCIINNELLSNISPFPETKQFLTDLVENGYTIKVITSRAYHPNALEVTKRWFNKYNLPFDEIIISGHGKRKADFIGKDENVIAAIDDNLDNYQGYYFSENVQNALLYTMPWNRMSRLLTIKRIWNLNDVGKKITL